VDTYGGVRVTLDKEFELTPRLMLFGEIEYDTHDLWEERVGGRIVYHLKAFLIDGALALRIHVGCWVTDTLLIICN